MPAQSNTEDYLPVLAFPPALTFYADDQATHKQVLTIFNPYDFHLKFRILSTDTHKYSVSDAQGVIKAQHRVNIVVHHKAVLPNNIGVSDKIRIQLFSSKRALGRKDTVITLLATKPESSLSDISSDSERFEQLGTDSVPSSNLKQHPMNGNHHERMQNAYIAVYVCSAIVALIALMLPNEDHINDSLPYYLHLSLQKKLVAAYVLGLVTAMLFRS